MKKITYEQACKLLEEKKEVKCRVSARQIIIIKDQNELDNKRRLAEQGVQGFELYKEKEKDIIPDGAMEISIDDAYDLLSKKEKVYSNLNGEAAINGQTELNRMIMSSRVRGEKLLLYWYV